MMHTHSTAGFRAYAAQTAAWDYAQALRAYRKRDKRALKKAMIAVNFRIQTLQKIVLEMTARADESRYWLICLSENQRRLGDARLTDDEALTLLAFVITENLP